MFAAQAVGAAGNFLSAQDTAKQQAKQAGEILANAKEEAKQTSKAQQRRRGAMRAAYAKQGVKVTGTAAVLIDEQVRQDDLELLKIKHNAQLQADAKIAEAKQTKQKALIDLIGGAGKAAGTGAKAGLFD